jgi:hypothetical protein
MLAREDSNFIVLTVTSVELNLKGVSCLELLGQKCKLRGVSSV